MLQRLSLMALLLLIVAACQTAPPPAAGPTIIPFPTMTPGALIRGFLLTPAPRPVEGDGLSNPATAVALANRPTATPDFARCPPAAEVTLPQQPSAGRVIADAVVRYLSDGGSAATLDATIRGQWNILNDNGLVRADLDLTGEGVADVLMSYRAPDDGGSLLIAGCGDGRYNVRYLSSFGGDTPTVIQIGDLNADGRPDILFASQTCAKKDQCTYGTQLITWRPDLARFVSLLERDISSDRLPTVNDVDGDHVSEIVVRRDNPGNSTTGPLRTGVDIYDWNGATYVRSIVQPDPPRFRILVIQDADSAFARLDMNEAIRLYRLALDNANLQPWRSDEGPVLQSYSLYRILLAHSYLDDRQNLDAYQAIVDAYPDPATAPVYAALSTSFWNAFQITNNLHSACVEVQKLIEQKPEALDLLNRYGDRSPTTSADMLCPF